MSDMRYALRALIKTPGPTLVVVLTLSVAIAAATVVYSTIDIVWYLLPIGDRDRLVYLPTVDPRRGEMIRQGLSAPDLADVSSQSKTLEEVGGFGFPGSASLTGVETPVRVSTIRVTANLPSMWGLRPQMGRMIAANDGATGAAGVLVLTDAFWRNQFGGREDVVGRSVLLDGRPHTVVGVLPPESEVGLFRLTDVLVPLPLDTAGAPRDQRDIVVTGRLAPGVSQEQARAEIETIAARLQASYPQTNAQVRFQVLPLIEMSGFGIQPLLFLLGLVAVLVVAIACANVVNVVLAQAAARAHEKAVRAALGASWLQQVRQTLLESLAMAAVAGVLGITLAAWGLAGLRQLGGDTLGFADLVLNARVLAVSALTAVLAAVGVGLLPVLRRPIVDLQALKEGGRGRTLGTSGRWIRTTLVASQVALAMILMVQIVVSVRTGIELRAINNGFDPRQLLTLRVELPAAAYTQPDQSRQFFTTLLDRLRSMPGVASVSMSDTMPVADAETRLPFTIEGEPARRPEERPLVARTAIAPSYRATMRIPLVAGRDFTDADAADAAPVALVNEEAARRFWPGGDPLGRRVAFVLPEGASAFLTIVGVVGNVRNSDIDDLKLAQVYVPPTLNPEREMALLVRASEGSDPLQLVESVRSQVVSLDPNQPIHDVATMEQVIADDLASGLVLATLLGAIGFVAICLAAAGIYGVVAYLVSQRTREIGLRIALGASPGRVRRLVLKQGTVPVVAGGVIGLIPAIAIASLTSGALSTIAARDPLNYVAVTVAIGLVALAALYVPAARASRVDPTVALRAD